MCGIAGWIGDSNHNANIEAAVNALHQRGPDYSGIVQGKNFTFGHTRLSILDISSAANQPFMVEGDNSVLIYNGEIFNFPELRSQLETKGITFRTTGDTEVLFHLLKIYGDKAPGMLNGFFAFAFYDGDKDQFLLARDRIGIKPLYYYAENKHLAFASELKALTRLHPKLETDPQSVALYLQLTYIPAPYTIYKNVKKLKPGHLIRYSQNEGPEIHNYYNPVNLPFDNYTGSLESAAGTLRELLTDSVKLRLISDVPAGTFLSGGIDSAVITILAAQEKPDIEAFSVGFSEEPWFDETRFATAVAKKHGIRHHILDIKGREVRDSIQSVLDYLDEPFADSSAIAMNMLSRKVGAGIRVALSGDGADELFGGYNKYRALLRVTEPGFTEKLVIGGGSIWRSLPSSRSGSWMNKIRQASKFSAVAALAPADRYWHLAAFNDPVEVSKLLNTDEEIDFTDRRKELMAHFGNRHVISDALLTDILMVLPDDMLTKVDRMSMCHSLEVRVPFLDYRIVEFALSLPPKFKINRKKGKLVLREAFKNELPVEVLNRSKKGFEVPLGKWLRTYASELIDEFLDPKSSAEDGILNESLLRGELNRFRKGNDDNATLIWQLLALRYWQQKHRV